MGLSISVTMADTRIRKQMSVIKTKTAKNMDEIHTCLLV